LLIHKFILQTEIADRVCSVYLNLYNKAAGAGSQEEAILGMGSFSMALHKNVLRYAPQICEVLKICIPKYDEVDVCKAAVGTLGDVVRSMEDGFNESYVETFVPMLFSLLNSRNVDRSIFSHVMSTLGDIAQFATTVFKRYIPQVITLVQQAMACKVNMKDEDDRDFLFELQEECFTCIAGIQGGLQQLNESRSILNYSGGITQCINMAYNYMDRPDGLSRAIVGAICDLVIAAGPQVKEVIVAGKAWAEFPNIVQTISQNTQDPMTRDNCKYAMEQIQLNMQG